MCLQSVDKFTMETPSDVRPVPTLYDRLIGAPGGLFSNLADSSVLAGTSAPANCSQMLNRHYSSVTDISTNVSFALDRIGSTGSSQHAGYFPCSYTHTREHATFPCHIYLALKRLSN